MGKRKNGGEGSSVPPPTLSTGLSAVDAMPRTESDSVKVSVRVRPFDKREQSSNSMTCVLVTDFRKATVKIRNPNRKELSGDGTKAFQFDHVFWSVEAPDASGASPATQADVFRTIGYPLVQHVFDGFNSCLFAYGQTGSGKTYTMMGANVSELGGEGSGVTPRICLEIFARKASVEVDGHSRWSVELGYVEVYNERVSDLLAKRKKGARAVDEEVYLNVREHPSRGVFLEGQRFVEVGSLDDVVRLMELGNSVRHTAATKMNDRSSRSHAIVMLLLREERTMTTTSGETIRTAGKSSRMNLVDLAGSERVAQSQVEGQQFREATHINLSLTTLGRVIDVLADMAKKGVKAQYSVAPFRDSKLTFILKDSLGGNSKTFMVATVSPSALNYEETLSTLRYASRARDIVNVAQVNEDPRARRIRELEEQMADMRQKMAGSDPAYVSELVEKLALLESEAQKRAADLQALEREREKNDIRDLMLKATEAERLELLERAEALEQEVTESKAQAERMELENKRMRALHREKEALLCAREATLVEHSEEMRRRQSSLENHREEWRVSLEEERLQKKLLFLQLREAEERTALVGNCLQDYVTEVRRGWSCVALNGTLLEYRKEVDAAELKVSQLAAASSELETRVAALQKELSEAQNATERAEASTMKLSEAATRAAAEQAHQLSVASLQLDELKRELEAATLENSTIRVQLEDTTLELDAKSVSLTEATRSAQELQDRLSSTTATVAALQEENSAYEAAARSAAQEKHQLSIELTALQGEQTRLLESLRQQQQATVDLARYDERWTFPACAEATITSSHRKTFPGDEWYLVMQEKSRELERTFRAEAALACHVRDNQITSLRFQDGSLQVTFEVQHPITVSAEELKERLENYPFRAMLDLYTDRYTPPSGLDALAAMNMQLQNDIQQKVEENILFQSEKERLQGELEEKGAEADVAHQDIDALRSQLEEATGEKERLQGELEEKGAEADVAHQDNDALRSQLCEAKIEKERLSRLVKEHSAKSAAAAETTSAMQNRLNSLATEMNRLGSLCAQSAESEVPAVLGLAEAEGTVVFLESKVKEVGLRLVTSENATRGAIAERERLDEELKVATRGRRKLERDNAKLKQSYVQCETERQKLEVRFDARRELQERGLKVVPSVTGKHSVKEEFKATRAGLRVLEKNGF